MNEKKRTFLVGKNKTKCLYLVTTDKLIVVRSSRGTKSVMMAVNPYDALHRVQKNNIAEPINIDRNMELKFSELEAVFSFRAELIRTTSLCYIIRDAFRKTYYYMLDQLSYISSVPSPQLKTKVTRTLYVQLPTFHFSPIFSLFFSLTIVPFSAEPGEMNEQRDKRLEHISWDSSLITCLSFTGSY